MKNLRKMVIKAIEREISLQEFERWLYDYADTAPLMHQPIWHELLEFNYTQKDAHYYFEGFLNYFDKQDYVLVMIEISCEKILAKKDLYNSLYKLERFKGYAPRLSKLTAYRERFDSLLFSGIWGKERLISQLQKEAGRLLKDLHQRNRSQKLAYLKQTSGPALIPAKNHRPWWKFWKKKHVLKFVS